MEVKRSFLLISLLYIHASCNYDKPKTLANVLASECFWDKTGEDQVIGGFNTSYQFLPDGRCFRYSHHLYNGSITDTIFRYYDSDVIVPDKWYTLGDTILVARNTRFEVLVFDTNSVTFKGYLNDTMIFLKNCKIYTLKQP